MEHQVKILAEPEWLTRKDTNGGTWVVEECRPVRGEPMTNIVGREMRVPTQNDDKARVIRAHELMHAKVSPAEEITSWIKRNVASKDALVVTEELRVNFLCQSAGFDMKEHLSDGGEVADGERIGAIKDWKSAVHMAIATAGTASNKLFLTGIRRHNRDWGPILLDISKRAVKEMKKASRNGNLASTEVDSRTKLSPQGFSHTERIAEWVDRIAGKSPEELQREKDEARKAREKAKADAEKEKGNNAGESEVAHSNEGVIDITKEGREDGNPYEGITPDKGGYGVPHWGELKVERLPMPAVTRGNIGKKRVATNMGLRPRRMHRMLTDPQQRIFDKTVRGSGGVVVLDSSGSMAFSHQQLTQILDNCAGATVIMYTDKGQGQTNCYIVADKGRMVNELPDVGYGNGVDFPALEFGLKHRQKQSSPFIWVTDGGVCGPHQGFSNMLALQCIKFCKKHNIVVVPHAEQAIKELNSLKLGNKAKSDWPEMLQRAWKDLMGSSITQ
jgi:hypothetical protein